MTDTAERPHLQPVPSDPTPAAGSGPSGPYLCGRHEPIPDGWQRTGPSPSTSTCMAYDPTRHTVVASLNVRYDRKLVEAVTLAGFERFQVPGSETGFFARDRAAGPPATTRPTPSPGLGR